MKCAWHDVLVPRDILKYSYLTVVMPVFTYIYRHPLRKSEQLIYSMVANKDISKVIRKEETKTLIINRINNSTNTL